MKKLLLLFTLLLTTVTGAWATTYDNPTRTTHKVGDATKTFVNASSTDGNVTSGNDRYLCYGTLYMLNSVTGDKFFERTSSTGGTTSSSYTYSTPATGFLAASSTSGTNTYGSINASSSRKWAMYFTGATQVSVLKKDNNTYDSKWVVLKLYSVAANGTETLVETKESSTNADKSNLKVLTCSTALSTSTYYKLEISAGYDSNNAIYQVSLKKPASAPTITAQPQDANYVEGTAAADVTALSVTATGTGDLYYQWFSNTSKSTTGAVSVQDKSKADGANTYKPSAATSGTTYYYCAVTDDNGTTNSGFATVVISAASAPTDINVSGDNSAARGDNAITLTAEVTGGVPTPTIEWFKCDDALKTNPVSQGEASTSNTTLDVATTTVGTYYYYAVASNSQGTVASDVKTITIVPKSPTITASASFVDSKDVTIEKADGESGDATIKYSTDNGESWSDYSAALNVTETTTVKAKVVQSTLESEVVSATYTKVTPHTWATVSAATTWDWEGNKSSLTTITIPENGSTSYEISRSSEDINLADFDGIVYSDNAGFPASFKADALLASKFQNPSNSSGYFQGTQLKFQTTVPGIITVEFSNTGGGTRPYRYLYVNGEQTTFKSNGTTHVNATGIQVPAGTVTIKGVMDPESSDPKAGTDQYLRIYKITFTPAVPVTISAAKYATFSSTQKLDFTGTGVTAYKATSTGESSVTLEEVTGIVPAETGLLLKADAGTYYIPVSTETATEVTGNKLVSTATAAHNIEAGEVGKAFVFGKLDEEVGFFKAAEGKTIGVGKSYLLLDTTPAKDVEFLSFVFGDEEQGETDGIKAVSTKVENGVRYNLAGQKVGADYKGIVIVNGKKVIIK